MNGKNLLPLISEIVENEIVNEPNDQYVVEKDDNPFFSEPIEYRYRQVANAIENCREDNQLSIDDQNHNSLVINIERISSVIDGEKASTFRNITLREFLWNRLHLDQVQKKYLKRYDSWKEWNGGVDYVPVLVTCDSAPNEQPRLSDSFFGEFCQQGNDGCKFDGLSLIMAEYGMGKTSFCMNLCRLSGAEKGWGDTSKNTEGKNLKDAFLEGETAFPILFDLNTYRNGDFDEYIVNRLHDFYHIHLSFQALAKLCHLGLFCVVLDAWDQMHGTPYRTQVEKDLESIKMIWEEKGRVLVTCRRSFYQKQLHLKMATRNGTATEAIQAAALFTIGGFSKETALEYLRKSAIVFKGGLEKNVNREWIDKCWSLNSHLMEKPLNLRLIAGHFDTVTRKTKFLTQPIRTYHFLNAILEQWRETNKLFIKSEQGADFLKTLVFMTLRSGLNRGISINEYKKKIANNVNADDALSRLKAFDFIEFRKSEGIKQPEIEFRLAAFQEYLWARYVLEELAVDHIPGRDNLINAYMLQLEVRAWITEELKEREEKWLYMHLRGDGNRYLGLKYRDEAEIGYSASNVLTLFRDLSKVPYYEKQFKDIKRDLRYFCFVEADLRGLDLLEASFDHSGLYRADLSYTNLSHASFIGSDLAEVVWDEFESIGKCAFIEDLSVEPEKRGERLSIAAGTKVGSVLTYNLPTGVVKVVNIDDSTINAIAADAEGIYTAAQNGWVGYIEAKSGELKNAYISANGLESIAPVGRASVYVGAERNGLFRYNWRTGARIAIDLGEEFKDIADVNYREIGEKRYIACILGNRRRELVLLELEGRSRAQIVARGELTKSKRGFDDICFAGNDIAYAVSGKGIFSISVNEMITTGGIYTLDDADLCRDELLRHKCDGHSSLAWAEESRMLFVREVKDDKIDSLTCIYWDENYKSEIRDLEWYFDKKNYEFMSDQINFCVSADGKFIAISGEKLAVFEWKPLDEYYELIRKPVEAIIIVEEAEFYGCKGLGKRQWRLFKDRGAKLDNELI